MAHTPGPWEVYGNVVRDDTGGVVAYAARANRSGEVSRSNAALIAAAPDLLRAVEKVGRIVGQIQDNPQLTADECATALSKAHSTLGEIYFATTGNPLKWWLPEPASPVANDEADFQEGLAALKIYASREGHTRVPTDHIENIDKQDG